MTRQPKPDGKTRRERDGEVWREVDVRGYTMMERARWGEGCVGCFSPICLGLSVIVGIALYLW